MFSYIQTYPTILGHILLCTRSCLAILFHIQSNSSILFHIRPFLAIAHAQPHISILDHCHPYLNILPCLVIIALLSHTLLYYATFGHIESYRNLAGYNHLCPYFPILNQALLRHILIYCAILGYNRL